MRRMLWSQSHRNGVRIVLVEVAGAPWLRYAVDAKIAGATVRVARHGSPVEVSAVAIVICRRAMVTTEVVTLPPPSRSRRRLEWCDRWRRLLSFGWTDESIRDYCDEVRAAHDWLTPRWKAAGLLSERAMGPSDWDCGSTWDEWCDETFKPDPGARCRPWASWFRPEFEFPPTNVPMIGWRSLADDFDAAAEESARG